MNLGPIAGVFDPLKGKVASGALSMKDHRPAKIFTRSMSPAVLLIVGLIAAVVAGSAIAALS